MTFKVVLFIYFSISALQLILGQTKSDLGRIATENTVYVRNGVQMSPKYDKEGQICQVILQPGRFSNKTVFTLFLGRNLVTGEDIKEIIYILDPESTRGKRTKTWGFIYRTGQTISTFYNYENIYISLSNSISFERKNTQEQAKVNERQVKSEDESVFDSAEVVTISWRKRQCVEN